MSNKITILRDLIDWYQDTNPSQQDIENELDYHKIDMSTEYFIEMVESYNDNDTHLKFKYQ